jgi:hypothetical protein
MKAFHSYSTTVLCLFIAGCDHFDPVSNYNCQMKGEIFRYRNGTKQSIDGDQSIQIQLGIFEKRTNLLVSKNELVPELNNPDLVLNAKNTNTVERYYQSESLDSVNNQKSASNIVINKLTGDARMFHRRWTLPSDWKNSDQYTLLGHCKKEMTTSN